MLSTEEIRKLPEVVRLAGYLARSAAHAEYGALLRTKYPDNDTPGSGDSQWTEEENLKWESLTDELEFWYYALSEEELKKVSHVNYYLSCLCNGEVPSGPKATPMPDM